MEEETLHNSSWLSNQFGVRSLISNYLIPEETNNFWYSLGGILGFALVFQVISGCILTLKYIPDAGLAYGIVSDMIHSRFWGALLGFHYFNAFLIFALILAHLMRVFISAAYRGNKKGLWLVGVALAVVMLGAYVTGESLHWDEVGFAVPWHISEILQATHLNNVLQYNFSDLKSIPTATTKLVQIYVLHIAIIPFLIILLLGLHLYLIRAKKISFPFWKQLSGRNVSFGSHIRAWILYGCLFSVLMLLLAVTVGRSVGTAPQLLPDSPLYGAHKGPGGLGFKPSWPIGWTHGMNVFVEHRGLTPDIWGTVIGMAIMVIALILIPFVDRKQYEPRSWREAFNFRSRWFAFILMGLFWLVLIVGIIQNIIALPG